MTDAAARDRAFKLTLSFATVYLVWGSSYLATKLMVGDLPPLTAAAERFMLAGVLLAGFALWRGERWPTARIEWRHIAITGFFAVVVSNGFNAYSMQYVASNQSALLNASPALWIAWLGTMGPRPVPLKASAKLGLAVGFVGVLLIMLPEGGLDLGNLGWQLVVLLGCVGWSLGTIYYRNAQPETPLLLFTGLQMFVGGVMLAAIGIGFGEPLFFEWTPMGLASFLWLTVLSSLCAYTAYAYLITHTTPALVGTYAYVNPAIATLLGWWVLDETLSPIQLVGTLVIFVGVAMVMGYLGGRTPPAESA